METSPHQCHRRQWVLVVLVEMWVQELVESLVVMWALVFPKGVDLAARELWDSLMELGCTQPGGSSQCHQ